MSRPRYCKCCKRADNGNGRFRWHENWDYDFFTTAVKNIKEFGSVLHLEYCKFCLKNGKVEKQ